MIIKRKQKPLYYISSNPNLEKEIEGKKKEKKDIENQKKDE